MTCKYFIVAAASGLVVSMGAMCPMCTSPNPTPTPTPVPLTGVLLNLTNHGGIAAGAPAFNDTFLQPFTVATTDKVITVTCSSSVPVDLMFGVFSPNLAVIIPINSTGITQSSSSFFTPPVVGIYNLYTAAVTAIPAGSTVNMTVTQ